MHGALASYQPLLHTRGINRFKGLALALAEVEKRGLGNIEGLAEYEAWTKEAKELSNPALLAVTQKSDNPCFEKALLWSIRTNRAIHALPAEDRPFPNVKSAMDAMAKQADPAGGVVREPGGGRGGMGQTSSCRRLQYASDAGGGNQGFLHR